MQKENQRSIIARLVRNETAACNTYRSLVGRVTNESAKRLLEKCGDGHEKALGVLSAGSAESVSASTSEVAGWKTFQLIVDDAADPTTDPTAIEALSSGEEQCELDYEQALSTQTLDASIAKKVKTELLPAIRTHREILSRLMHDLHSNKA